MAQAAGNKPSSTAASMSSLSWRLAVLFVGCAIAADAVQLTGNRDSQVPADAQAKLETLARSANATSLQTLEAVTAARAVIQKVIAKHPVVAAQTSSRPQKTHSVESTSRATSLLSIEEVTNKKNNGQHQVLPVEAKPIHEKPVEMQLRGSTPSNSTEITGAENATTESSALAKESTVTVTDAELDSVQASKSQDLATASDTHKQPDASSSTQSPWLEVGDQGILGRTDVFGEPNFASVSEPKEFVPPALETALTASAERPEDPEEVKRKGEAEERKLFIGLPKIFWALVADALGMAAFILCIPGILHISKRRYPVPLQNAVSGTG